MLHLNSHSVYSYKNAISYVDAIAKRSAEMGEKSFCITDINSLTGFIKGALVATSMDMKFVQGLDVSIFPDEAISENVVLTRIQFLKKEMGLKRTTEELAKEYREEIESLEKIDKVPSHNLTLIAKNLDGLKNLMAIYNQQTSVEEDWMIEKEKIFNHANGLICLVGGYNSDIHYWMHHGDEVLATVMLYKYLNAFQGNIFAKLEWDTDDKMIQLFKLFNIPLVATNDCRYVNKDEKLDYRLFRNIFSTKLIQSFRENSWMMNEDEFHNAMAHPLAKECFNEALNNIRVIESMCENVLFPKAKPLIDCSEQLLDLCEKGWERLRKGTDKEEESRIRFEYELSVINGKGFSQYFIKVLNIINVARQLGIMVGPARGSGGGCEVCFLIGITRVDPLQYNLYFERFLNPGRPGYPDIDLDFASMANP